MPCSIWDLGSLTRDGTQTPALGARSLSHWTTKEVSCIYIYTHIYFLAVLGLRCFARALSSCSERGLLYCSAQASHRGRFSCCSAQALRAQPAAIAARGFGSRGRVDSVALWHVDSSPTRVRTHPLHWQMDSYLLCHQGSPILFFKTIKLK